MYQLLITPFQTLQWTINHVLKTILDYIFVPMSLLMSFLVIFGEENQHGFQI